MRNVQPANPWQQHPYTYDIHIYTLYRQEGNCPGWQKDSHYRKGIVQHGLNNGMGNCPGGELSRYRTVRQPNVAVCYRWIVRQTLWPGTRCSNPWSVSWPQPATTTCCSSRLVDTRSEQTCILTIITYITCIQGSVQKYCNYLFLYIKLQ